MTVSEPGPDYNEDVSGPRPRGALETIDDAWRRRVNDWLARNEVSRSELARRAKVSAAAITVLLRPSTAAKKGPRQSRIAMAVARVTGVDLKMAPSDTQRSEDIEELLQVLRYLYDHDRPIYDEARNLYQLLAKNVRQKAVAGIKFREPATDKVPHGGQGKPKSTSPRRRPRR